MMEEKHLGFDVGQVMVGILKILKAKGIADEETILDLLWEAKDPLFPWDKNDIKLLLKL